MHAGARIRWYRSPVDREAIARLNRRSDLLGLLQTGGYLATLAATGAAAWWSLGHTAWPLAALALLAHGTCYAFMINGFHELVHDSVFRTHRLNRLFLAVFSFLGWHNPVHFWASHTAHHKYTLHPPADLEVVVPTRLTWWRFVSSAVVNPRELWLRIAGTVRLASGRLHGEWLRAIPSSGCAAAWHRS